ncbi:hypothetical protein [Cupriavidus pauculus]|uniref:hypothetical protein n=1 Tax=Cupriavidus pauculus TaxID=82633 RepID=UPI001EE2FEFA|nr:hypothetical protein [Cupriavidus pauculus]GJG95691.1 hypothetical protein CBA19C6_14400 [Cupriavidus pauculus]
MAHFAFTDPETGTEAQLDIDTQTREFVYTESGVKAGEGYRVSSQGNLHAARALAPAAEPEAPAADMDVDPIQPVA